MLQDPLNLILLILIDHNWWHIGLHSIILIGLEESHAKDIIDSLQHLPVTSSSEVQAIGSLPYSLHDYEVTNIPAMQFPGALQSQVSSD